MICMMADYLDCNNNKEELPEEQECDLKASYDSLNVLKDGKSPFKRQIIWSNLLVLLALHLSTVYGFYLCLFRAKILTYVWSFFIGTLGGIGAEGAHRFYAHRSYKVKPPFRLSIVLFHTIAGQKSLWSWVRDHRQHHKYSDTDADPHNATNGFFFSHIGWLMSQKHPDVIEKSKTIDMSDMKADPFVMFQKRHYKILYFLLSFGIPTLVPWWLWDETLATSFVAFLGRTAISLNVTFLVNSVAHKYGYRPYTKDILAVDCAPMAWAVFGEGYHNFHHTFPWDYRAAEAGRPLNLGAWLIELAAECGWAYDLRSASPAAVASRALKRGDGSHPLAATGRRAGRTVMTG